MFHLLSQSSIVFLSDSKSDESEHIKSRYLRLSQEVQSVQSTLSQERKRGEDERTRLWAYQKAVTPHTPLPTLVTALEKVLQPYPS